MNYKEQLKQVAWHNKRKKILDRDKHRCINCNSDKKLQVHHLYYINGNLAWQHPDKALVTLCDSCHKVWHDTHEIEIRDKCWTKNREYLPPKRHGEYKKKKIKITINDLPSDERKKIKKKKIILERKIETVNKKLELLEMVNLPQDVKDRLFDRMDFSHIVKYLESKGLYNKNILIEKEIIEEV